MKKNINITIDLTKDPMPQIEEASKKITAKKPWWKRIFCWC